MQHAASAPVGQAVAGDRSLAFRSEGRWLKSLAKSRLRFSICYESPAGVDSCGQQRSPKSQDHLHGITVNTPVTPRQSSGATTDL